MKIVIVGNPRPLTLEHYNDVANAFRAYVTHADTCSRHQFRRLEETFVTDLRGCFPLSKHNSKSILLSVRPAITAY